MFKPDFIFKTITDITVDFLQENNITALLLDVDNTLSVAHSDKTLRNGVTNWLSKMRDGGISLLILSNAKTKRAKSFGDSISLNTIGMAAKPLPFGYLKAVKVLKTKKKNVAMVGDQIFTDILGGNVAGVNTILLTDITPEDKPSFKIKRRIERILLKRWKYER